MPSRYTSIPVIILRERMFATILKVDLDWGRVTIDTAGNEILRDFGKDRFSTSGRRKNTHTQFIHEHNYIHKYMCIFDCLRTKLKPSSREGIR